MAYSLTDINVSEVPTAPSSDGRVETGGSPETLEHIPHYMVSQPLRQ
jgi:hypothetical protein